MSKTAIDLAIPGSTYPQNYPPKSEINNPYMLNTDENTAIDAIEETGSSLLPEKKSATPLIPYSGERLPGEFQLIQLWEGYVISATNDKVYCRLIDKTEVTNPEEEVAIPLEEFEPTERDLAKPGAVFYWSIRYADYGRGREKISAIRFRRLPPISKSIIERSKQQAKSIEEFFKNDNE